MSMDFSGLRSAVGALVLGTGLVLTASSPAWAQAVEMSVSQTVVPAGAAVDVTITGAPGQFFAVGGSAMGSGLTYGGVALALGNDAVVLASGVIDGTGSVVVSVTPPFRGTVLDRYYLIGVTAPNASFIPPNLLPRRHRQERRPPRRRDWAGGCRRAAGSGGAAGVSRAGGCGRCGGSAGTPG